MHHKGCIFIGILLRDRTDGFRHLVGAGYDEVPVLLRCIEKHRLPLGRIVADFEDSGLDLVAIFVLDHFHAVGGTVEEGFVAKRAIDDEHDLVFASAALVANVPMAVEAASAKAR